jgi:formylglycine-generating enzyme required for sulfatase activity
VRTAARRIVLRLVSDARTRAVRERNDLVGDSAVAAAALESLVRGRLVVARDTASGAPSYELAHEALIRGWGALRDWLDEEAGQLAARNRLTAAAAEWQRLERRPDLLWTRRQLDEVHALDELTAGERGFVDASRRLVRRRRLARIAAIAAVSVVALAIAAVRLDSARARVRAFAALVDVAGAREVEAARLAGQAAAARAAAFARFDADDGPGGDQRWTEARRLSSAAQEHYATAAAQLEGAFAIDSAAARQRLAAIVWAEAELAEAEHDEHRVAAQLARLRRYDPERAARWDEPGRVVLAIDRPGRIAIHAFGCYHRPDDCVPGGGGPTIAGGFDQASVVVRDAARLDHALAPGSYLAVIEMPDGPVIRAPFVVGHGQDVALTIAVPLASVTPAGFVYIPEGDFLYGSNSDDAERANLGAQPLHRVHGRAFWISRSEVTFAQWIAFLRDLPPAARRQYLPSAGDVSLDERAGRFVVALEPSPDQRRSAAEGELLIYPGRESRREVRWEQLPVSGVSYVDAVAYAAWLVRTGRVPGARLCTDREWEHAARGADGRSYPHGRALHAADANIDETYGRKPAAFGPDEVGSYPASNSPYDVADLAGNVWELVIVGKDKPWLVGGSFYQTAFAASCENRGNPADRSQVSIRAGLRICADAASAR